MAPRKMTPEQRQAVSDMMRKRWKDPDFVDKHIKAMVRRWQNPVYRRRQIEAIEEGRRGHPLSGNKGDQECSYLVELPGGQQSVCIRRDQHEYHVTLIGAAHDGSLRVHGSA